MSTERVALGGDDDKRRQRLGANVSGIASRRKTEMNVKIIEILLEIK